MRSLLGVHSETDWIEEFNIGTIMHMSSITHRELKRINTFMEELTKRSLYDKVIYCSVVYFTISTEIRFLEDPNSSGKAAAIGKTVRLPQSRSEAFKLSELYHLKAIEIMCQGISTCSPYLNHLIASYYKHYFPDAGLGLIE